MRYEERQRSVDWYWAVGIIALVIAVVAIIYRNYLLALLVIVGVFALLLYAARKPRMVLFELAPSGIRINNVLYPYAALRSFWIHHHRGGTPRQNCYHVRKTFMPYIIIPLPDSPRADDMHRFLAERLKEEEHPDSLSEVLLERLGF